MKLGFSGTREGMTPQQMKSFKELVFRLNPDEFHHGSCRGSDVQAARLVRSVLAKCVIHAHPSLDARNTESSGVDDVTHPAKQYHARNRDIVDGTDELAACPKEYTERDTGGTWHAVRHARAKMKPRHMIWPDGIEQVHTE